MNDRSHTTRRVYVGKRILVFVELKETVIWYTSHASGVMWYRYEEMDNMSWAIVRAEVSCSLEHGEADET